MINLKYKILKKKRILDCNFSFEDLKLKFSLSSDINFIQLIDYLNNNNISIAIACTDKDSFLLELKKDLLLKKINKYSEFKKEVLREIDSYNDFLFNVNFDENGLKMNKKKGIYPFSRREIVEIKRKIKNFRNF